MLMRNFPNAVKNLQNSLLKIELQYFPCINAIFDIVESGSVFFDHELLFRRSSLRNRMILPGGNGLVSLTIPIVGGRSVKLPYAAVEIDYSGTWQRDHLRTIETIYGNSPFFYHYQTSLKEIFDQKPQFLVDWNATCFDWIIKKMKLNVTLVQDSAMVSQNLNIRERIDFYLPSNHDKIEKGPFIKYTQLFEDRIGFKSNVSILDLLFNLGPNALKKNTILTKPLC